MNLQAFWQLLKETYSQWNEDKVPRLAAALAYYTVFSLAPFLIVLLAITGMVFDQTTARGYIVRQVQETFGRQAETLILTMLNNANAHGSGIWATLIGAATLLLGACGLFGLLQDALNTIWEVAPAEDRGWMVVIQERFLSFLMVLGTGFLLLISLVLSAAVSALSRWMSAGWMAQVLDLAISLGVITLLFAMIFKILPDAQIRWSDVWIGAVMAALLFIIGKWALGLYLGRTGVASTYGQAGSLVLVLLWVYYAAQILFFGAEFTQVYAGKYGSGIVPARGAVRVTETERAQQGMPRQS